MRKISLDDVGRVMPDDYYVNCKWSNLTGNVYTIMVIKVDSQALAITVPLSRIEKCGLSQLSGNQRKAIRWFMRRNK